MIYVDSSVALGRLLFKPRSPAASFWQERLVSSRLLEYEVWKRVHAYGLISSHAEPERLLLMGIELLEMDRPMLARALQPWPPALLASYDARLLTAARALGVELVQL